MIMAPRPGEAAVVPILTFVFGLSASIGALTVIWFPYYSCYLIVITAIAIMIVHTTTNHSFITSIATTMCYHYYYLAS